MARTQAQALARRERLREMLAAGAVSTVQAARRLHVNPMTIRRDLAVLERTSQAIRCYGGAIPGGRVTFEFRFDERHRHNLPAKQRIGREAAGRIAAGHTAFLDTGTTTLEIARALARRDVPCRVVTSSLVVASQLWGHGRIEPAAAGRPRPPGLPRPGRVADGDDAGPPDGRLGLSRQRGRNGRARQLRRRPGHRARVAQRMLCSARRVAVVADASKLGRPGTARYATVGEIHALITDSAAPAAEVRALRKAGVIVTIV